MNKMNKHFLRGLVGILSTTMIFFSSSVVVFANNGEDNLTDNSVIDGETLGCSDSLGEEDTIVSSDGKDDSEKISEAETMDSDAENSGDAISDYSEEENADETVCVEESDDVNTDDSEMTDADDSETTDADGQTDANSDITDGKKDIDGKTVEEIEEEKEIVEDLVMGTQTNGWVKDDNGYKYYEKGVAVKSKAKQINGIWYYFNSSGYMLDGDEIWTTDEKGQYVCYRARSGGALYVNEWYQDVYEDYFWYGSGGKANVYPALVDVNGKTYLLSYGGLYCPNFSEKIGNDWYAADDYGLAVKLNKGGWTKAGSRWYYIKSNGTTYNEEFARINNNTYYFPYGDGAIYCDDDFYVYNSETGDYDYYRAKSNGPILVNEWFLDANGDYYWYGADGRAPKEDTVLTINNQLYVFGYAGRLRTNDTVKIGNYTYIIDYKGHAYKALNNQWTKVGDYYYYSVSGNLLKDQTRYINGYYYAFDSMGRMVSDGIYYLTGGYLYAEKSGHLLRNQWKLYNNHWYYFGSNCVSVNGWKTIDGSLYYFNTYMLTDCYVLRSEYSLYRIDGSGKATYVSNPNGLFYGVYSDFYVYYTNGDRVEGSWVYYKGKTFLINCDGRSFRNTVAKSNGTYYYFTGDGTLAKDGWIKDGFYTYYAYSYGALATGEQKIDGKWYYFDSNACLIRTGTVKYNGNNYILNPDGSYWKKAQEGWNEANGMWYYVKNGQFVKSSSITVKGISYAFDYYGVMITNNVSGGYYYDSNGKRVTKIGWQKVGNDWYYVEDSNGNLIQDQTKTIGGYIYAFDYSGRMVSDDIYEGEYYDINGHRTKKKEEKVQNGWVLNDGKYSYFENGKRISNRWVGDYYLGSDGYMCVNSTTPDGYYVGYDGKYVKNAVWGNFIINSNGKLAKEEWLKIDGKYYYADKDGISIKGLCVVNGNLYQFNENGVFIKTIAANAKNNTWYQVDGAWTYIKDGQVIHGVVNIDGYRYYLDSYGYMKKNQTAYDPVGGRMIYFGSDGKEDKTVSGWRDGYYYGMDHHASSGWVLVNGKLYYGYSGAGNSYRKTYQLIGGILYHFNQDGSVKNEVYQTNGWLKLNDDYYYFKNGRAQTGLVTLGDKTYALGYDGILLKNAIVVIYAYSYNDTNYYYVNSEGYIDKKEGFRTINGKQYYVGNNGKLLTGIRKINGKTYYFGDLTADAYY